MSRRAQGMGAAKERVNWARSVILLGKGGEGKTATVLSMEQAFREAGFFGIGKFEGESAWLHPLGAES